MCRTDVDMDFRHEPESLNLVLRREELTIEALHQVLRVHLRADQRDALIRVLAADRPTKGTP